MRAAERQAPIPTARDDPHPGRLKTAQHFDHVSASLRIRTARGGGVARNEINKSRALNCVNVRRSFPRYLAKMVRQNFAATAAYFERRAAKTSAAGMRRQLKAAAGHYRSLAEMYGQCNGEDGIPGPLIAVPPRRQRLIELFQAGNNASPLLVLGRQSHDEEH